MPRDAGAGWDFEDVRDHYLRLLFGVDPSELRAHDVDRYLALGRVATGEAMLRTFSEWRRPGSSCRGGLVWLARDLRPGAGWGVVDSSGRPKAAYWYLKRALAPVALLAIDEGLNGLWLHALNDTCEPIDAELRVALYRDGRRRGTPVSTPVTVPGRGSRSIHADGLFDGFIDLTYAYRFGPPGHDVVAATLRNRATGVTLASAHCFPCGLPAARDHALGLSASVDPIPGGYTVVLGADRFAHAVAVEAEGFVPEDNYVHLEPGESKRLAVRRGAGQPLHGSVAALNGTVADLCRIRRRGCSLSRLRRPQRPRPAPLHHARRPAAFCVASSGAAGRAPARRGGALPAALRRIRRAYRVWRIFAERLAGLGFDVLRFDYEGTGDSAGDPEPGRLDAWLRNIERVVEEARRLAGSSEVALVGFRIGATLALQAAVAQGGVIGSSSGVPSVPGGRTCASSRRLPASSQGLREGSRAARTSSRAGYVLPGPIARALERLGLDTLSSASRAGCAHRGPRRSPAGPLVGERLEPRIRRHSVRPPGTASMLERGLVQGAR